MKILYWLVLIDFYVILVTGLLAAILIGFGLDRENPRLFGRFLASVSVLIVSHIAAAIFGFIMISLGVDVAGH